MTTLVAVLLFGLVLVAATLIQNDHTSAAPPPGPIPTEGDPPIPWPLQFTGLLDGVVMSDADWQARRDLLPVAVMIDNSGDAYPHSGLTTADLVYEGLVEGGITRFMAVYWRQESAYIEPVRSARTPFVVWADELDALYAHAGEADTDNEADAGGQIRDWNIYDLNAFADTPSSAFYRDWDRAAPHNLVTSTPALREAGANMGYAGPPTMRSWLYKADGDGTASLPAAEGIDIDFVGSRNSWQIAQWRWDAALQSYGRFEFGVPHVDAQTGEQLHFRNVIVARFDSEVVDDSGHVVLNQFGSGPATVFLDGKKIDGTWSKQDLKSRLRFYNGDGVEVQFNRGSTFVEVISQQSTLIATETAGELPSLGY